MFKLFNKHLTLLLTSGHDPTRGQLQSDTLASNPPPPCALASFSLRQHAVPTLVAGQVPPPLSSKGIVSHTQHIAQLGYSPKELTCHNLCFNPGGIPRWSYPSLSSTLQTQGPSYQVCNVVSRHHRLRLMPIGSNSAVPEVKRNCIQCMLIPPVRRSKLWLARTRMVLTQCQDCAEGATMRPANCQSRYARPQTKPQSSSGEHFTEQPRLLSGSRALDDQRYCTPAAVLANSPADLVHAHCKSRAQLRSREIMLDPQDACHILLDPFFSFPLSSLPPLFLSSLSPSSRHPLPIFAQARDGSCCSPQF